MNILYVIRQRHRALIGVFLVVAGAYFGCNFFFDREYTAFAQVSDFNPHTAGSAPLVGANSPYLAPLKSDDLVRKVAAGLSDADRRRLVAPYLSWLHWGPNVGAVEVLLGGRRISATERMVDIGFQHPDPALAALIANAFADEFVRESAAAKDDREHKSIGDLQAQVEEQRKKTDSLQKQMADLSAQYGVTNLDSTADSVYLGSIQDLNKQVIQFKSAMDTLDLRKQQILDQVAAKKFAGDLDFIRSQTNISQLYASAQAAATHVEELQSEGFQPEAVAMTEAVGRRDGAMKELNAAVEAAIQQVVADLQAATNNYNQALKRLQDMQRKVQELSGARAIYDGLHKQFDTASEVLSKLQVSVTDADTNFKLTDPNYAMLARAETPALPDARPWARMSLKAFAFGAGGSLLALLGFAVFRPPPKQEREEYERRRRRHRHFHSSRHRSGSGSKSSQESSSSSSRHRH